MKGCSSREEVLRQTGAVETVYNGPSCPQEIHTSTPCCRALRRRTDVPIPALDRRPTSFVFTNRRLILPLLGARLPLPRHHPVFCCCEWHRDETDTLHLDFALAGAPTCATASCTSRTAGRLAGIAPHPSPSSSPINCSRVIPIRELPNMNVLVANIMPRLETRQNRNSLVTKRPPVSAISNSCYYSKHTDC